MTLNESTGYQRLHTEDNDFSPLASNLGPTQASSTHQRLPPHVVDNQSNAARVASLSAPQSLCRSRALNVAWESAVTFADEKLESLIQAIHDLDLEPHSVDICSLDRRILGVGYSTGILFGRLITLNNILKVS